MWGGSIFGSSIARLAAIIMAAQVVTLGIGIYVMYSFSERVIIADAKEATNVARDDFIDDFNDGGLPFMREAIATRLAQNDDPDFVILVRKPDGSTLIGNLNEWPASIGDTENWRVIELYRTGHTAPEQMGITTQPLKDGYVLLAGHVLEEQRRLTRASEKSAIYAFLLGLMLSAAVAFGIARLLERRIDGFSDTAAEVERGNLAARVKRNQTGDAFDRLGHSINAMLDRIERLVRELRIVTDSMAHDLRTPVSRMKVALERAVVQTDDRTALTALGGAIEEADSLHAMLNTALEITRAEAGIGRDQFTRFSVFEMMHDIAEIYGPLAENNGVEMAVNVTGKIEVIAHKDMLVRAISNLVDNSLKYGGGGSILTLHAAATKGQEIALSVIDDGVGIPADQIALARKRFGRLDPARTMSGSGLGLSLVETIATLHGGSMELRQNQPTGLRVTMALPILASK